MCPIEMPCSAKRAATVIFSNCTSNFFIKKIWGRNQCVQLPHGRVENGVAFICVMILAYLFQFNEFNS